MQTAYDQRDFQGIKAVMAAHEDVAIIGGGLLAVELAARLAPHTLVRLCFRGDLLGRYAGSQLARRVAQYLTHLGVRLESRCEIQNAQCHGDALHLHARDGRVIVTSRAILACGLRPRTHLARQAGLAVAGGIRVDHAMRTNDLHIHAVGDCSATTARGNIALGSRQADLAIAHLLGREHAATTTHSHALRRIDLGRRTLVCLEAGERAHSVHSTRIQRRQRHGMLALTLDHGRIVACQALLPPEQAERLARLITGDRPPGRYRRACLHMGIVLPPRTPDPVICRCAGVRRSRIDAAAHAPGATATTVANATGAGLMCGACSDQIAAIASGQPRWPSPRLLTLSLLALAAAAVAAGAPTLASGDRVRTLAFKAFALLSREGIRQLSGYLSVAFIIAALSVYVPRRHLWPKHATIWHVACGSLALAVLPLHVLGGITIGSGINRILVELFVACVFLGVIALWRRTLRTARWLHVLATAMLMAALALHVTYVYQY